MQVYINSLVSGFSNLMPSTAEKGGVEQKTQDAGLRALAYVVAGLALFGLAQYLFGVAITAIKTVVVGGVVYVVMRPFLEEKDRVAIDGYIASAASAVYNKIIVPMQIDAKLCAIGQNIKNTLLF